MLNVIARYAAPEAKYWLITKHNVFKMRKIKIIKHLEKENWRLTL